MDKEIENLIREIEFNENDDEAHQAALRLVEIANHTPKRIFHEWYLIREILKTRKTYYSTSYNSPESSESHKLGGFDVNFPQKRPQI